MILRRFLEHFKKQNWVAIGLDLIVVVVGIYIGLQADAWNSSRQDRALERQYLERLLADAEMSLDAQERNMAEFDRAINSIDFLATELSKRNLDESDPEKLAQSMDEILWVAPVATNMTTINELLSTGNISLIGDIEIRQAIGDFVASFRGAEFATSQNVWFMAAAAPEVMTWDFYKPSSPGNHRSVTYARDPSYGYTHELDYDRMLQNPDGARIVSWISGWSKYYGAELALHHEHTIEFRDLLKAKLEGRQD